MAKGVMWARLSSPDSTPPGEDGRVPVIAVTGTNGKTTTVRLCAHLLRSNGLRVGMTNTDGV
jgi:cyanophycin synthetase